MKGMRLSYSSGASLYLHPLAWLGSFLLLAAGIASTSLPGGWFGLGGSSPNSHSTAALNLTGSSGDWNDVAGEDSANFGEEEYLTTPIEELKKGDLVLALNLESGELEERPIVGVMVRTSHKLRVMQVEAADGSTQEFKTTDEHPFFVIEANDFVSAGSIELGQHFLAPDGLASTLVSSLSEDHPEGVQVYNFEVQDAHNYFVLGATGIRGPPVLVHNSTTGPAGLTCTPVDADGNPIPKTQGRNARGHFLKKDGSEGRPGAIHEAAVETVVRQISDDGTTAGQVRIQTKSGTLVIVDVGSRKGGNIKLTEAKESAKGSLTKNQRPGYAEIGVSGGVVVGSGSDEFRTGTVIPPTRVRIVRPAHLERLNRLRGN